MPILPVEGAQITVVTREGELLKMKVYAVDGSPKFTIWVSSVDGCASYAEVFPPDEGVSWCRGWEGPDVNALKVATGLR